MDRRTFLVASTAAAGGLKFAPDTLLGAPANPLGSQKIVIVMPVPSLDGFLGCEDAAAAAGLGELICAEGLEVLQPRKTLALGKSSRPTWGVRAFA